MNITYQIPTFPPRYWAVLEQTATRAMRDFFANRNNDAASAPYFRDSVRAAIRDIRRARAAQSVPAILRDIVKHIETKHGVTLAKGLN